MATPELVMAKQIRTYTWAGPLPAALHVEPFDLERLPPEFTPAESPQEEAGRTITQDVVISLSCPASQFSPPVSRA